MDPSKHPAPEDYENRYKLHNNNLLDMGYRKFLMELALPCFDLVNKKSECLDYGCGSTKGMEIIFKGKGYNMESYDPCFYPEMKEKKYDLITCNEVIEHFYKPVYEFKKLFGFLKNKGFLVIGTNRWNAKTDFSTWHYLTDFTHTSIYNKQTIKYLSVLFDFKITGFYGNRIAVLEKGIKAGD